MYFGVILSHDKNYFKRKYKDFRKRHGIHAYFELQAITNFNTSDDKRKYYSTGYWQTFLNVGGRTMTAANKKYYIDLRGTIHSIKDFDAVSLYPSAMYRLELPLGKPKMLTLNDEQKSTVYCDIPTFLVDKDSYFVTIEIVENPKPYKFPIISKITPDGLRDWTNGYFTMGI